MKFIKSAFLAVPLFFMLSCVTNDEPECDMFIPCPEGYFCNLELEQCQPESTVTDNELTDNSLPTDNELPDDNIPDNEPSDNEKTDDPVNACEPYELIECDENDFYNIIRCNSSGTGTESVPCGDMTVCENGKCVQQLCEPQKPICNEEDPSKVFECNYLGTAPSDDILEDCGDGGYCQAGKCVFYCDIAAIEHSYLGCDYFTANLNTSTQRSDPIYALTISNIDSKKSVTVDITSFSASGEIDAGQCYFCLDSETSCQSRFSSKGLIVGPGQIGIIQFPSTKMIKGTGLKWDSYHVKTNLPVTVYQFSPIDNSFNNPFEASGKSVDYNFLTPENGKSYSNDASLLIPSTSVYTDYVASAKATSAATSYVTVVGVSDTDTKISIKPSVAITAGGGVPAIAAGAVGTVTVKKGQVVQIEQKGLDITGTRVYCDKTASDCFPFAVFSGTDCVNIPDNYGYCDHIEHQMFPVQTWGKKYIIVKSKARSEEWDFVRILASEDSTKLTFSPETPAQISTPSGWRAFTVNPVKTEINAGEYSEFYFKGTLVVEADKPIMVAQYLAGADMISLLCQGTDYDYHAANCPGDPAMMLIPPAEQFRKNYQFLTPGSYQTNYATVVMTTGEAPKINGSAVSGIKEITGTDYSYAIVDLGNAFKTHTLECATNPCGLFVYGWEMDVSYAYPGGLNLEKLSND